MNEWPDTTTDINIGPPYSGWLTPDSELEEIELGERASDWLLSARLASMVSPLEAAVQSYVRFMVGEVASVTSWLGKPFPALWWPPSAGEQS